MDRLFKPFFIIKPSGLHLINKSCFRCAKPFVSVVWSVWINYVLLHHHSTLSIPSEQTQRIVSRWRINFRSESKKDFRNFALPQSFSESLNTGWGLCVHLRATAGTVTKTGWFRGSDFNCDSAAICACVSMCAMKSSGFCVCVLCYAVLCCKEQEECQTIEHIHGGSKDSCIPVSRLPSCATYTTGRLTRRHHHHYRNYPY